MLAAEPAPERPKTIGIQVGAVSFFDEGVEEVLDILQERGRVNTIYLTTFTYDVSRCMFCGLCEDACPVDALELTQDFELASYTREDGIWDRQMLEEGPRPTQYA